MHDSKDSEAPVAQPGARQRASGPSRRRWAVLAVPLTLGGLVLASQAGLASATPGPTQASSRTPLHLAAAVPPAGRTWIEGVVTDQANNAQDNVNVEAWPADPLATAPVASALTYGGPPGNSSYAHGFFLLEVPSGQAFRIVFSGVLGQEDGDDFRMKQYGHGRPIMVRNLAAAAGRIRDLGPVQLVRQGRVASTTKATLPRAKVAPSTRARLRVRVTSPFVTNVTGKVVVRVAGKKKTYRLTQHSHGKATFKLPHLKKPGHYKVTASFTRTGTVQPSKAKPVRLTVRKKK